MSPKPKSRSRKRRIKHVPLFVPSILAATCGLLALLALRLANAPSWDERAAGFVILLAAVVTVAGAAWLMVRRSDQPAIRALVAATTFLVGMGVLMQHRVKGIQWNALTASEWAYLCGIPLAMGIALVLQRGRYRRLEPLGVFGALFSIGGLAALLVLGTRFRGAVFGPGRMTPTELIKPLLVVFLATIFQSAASGSAPGRKRKASSRQPWGWYGALWVVLMLMLAYQRDLGMMLILNAVLGAMAFVAHRTYRIAAIGTGLALAGSVAVLLFVPHARHRLDAWLDPFASPTGRGWQVLQSLSALYNGGLFGTGLGEGAPQAIPVASSDFIYAAIGEEIGLVGCALVLAVFGALLSAGYRIAADCKDPFGRLLAVGLTTSIGTQLVLNVGGVTKALPLTGVPLPFVSHGGMNVLVSFLMIGMLVAIAIPGQTSRKKRK